MSNTRKTADDAGDREPPHYPRDPRHHRHRADDGAPRHDRRQSEGIPRYGRIPDACRRYGWSRSRIYLLAGEGRIRMIKDGKATLVDYSSADDYMASRPPAEIRPPKSSVSA